MMFRSWAFCFGVWAMTEMKGGFITVMSLGTKDGASSESATSRSSTAPPFGSQSRNAKVRVKRAIAMAAADTSRPTIVSAPSKPVRRRPRTASCRNAADPHAGSLSVRLVLELNPGAWASVWSTMLRARAGGVKCVPPRVTRSEVAASTKPKRSGAGALTRSKCASWKSCPPACRIARLGCRVRVERLPGALLISLSASWIEEFESARRRSSASSGKPKSAVFATPSSPAIRSASTVTKTSIARSSGSLACATRVLTLPKRLTR